MYDPIIEQFSIRVRKALYRAYSLRPYYRGTQITKPIQELTDDELLGIWGIGVKGRKEIRSIIPAPPTPVVWLQTTGKILVMPRETGLKAAAWDKLYQIYGEILDQDGLDWMDKVLAGVTAHANDEKQQRIEAKQP